MKHLPLIFVVGLILSSCNNDKSNIIINVNMIGENTDSIQKVIDNSLKNDTAKVININIYNNIYHQSDKIIDTQIGKAVDTVIATTTPPPSNGYTIISGRTRKRRNNANQTEQ